MPSHNSNPEMGHDPEDHTQEEIDASLGYERRDVSVTGIIVFLVAMFIFVVVTAVVCYGVGKVLNAHMNKEDGPTTKWTKTVNIRELGNMPSSPAMQNQVANLMETFPAPRLEVDNGNVDVEALHAREGLLLYHYTWVDKSKGAVRIPIERAMELVAQRGLPVAAPAKVAPLMAGDSRPQVTAPLTDGFAPTTFEQEQARAAAVQAGREVEGK